MSQHIVFFVGPDRCGKTEIAKATSRVTGIPYFKATSEHSSYLSSKVSKQERFLYEYRYAEPRVFDVLKQTGHSIIFDRGFPCEAVYSKVMNRKTDDTMLHHMDQMWASIDARIVLCYRTTYAGIVDDLDAQIDAGVLQQLTTEYFRWAESQTHCKVHKLCVDDENLGREVGEVLEFMAHE